MTMARRETITDGVAVVCHCVTRCVRRAWICGKDPFSGKDYSHRKAWIERRIRHLATCFAIDICSYSLLSNHVHIILHNRPDQIANWSDEEVATSWRRLYCGKRVLDNTLQDVNDARVAELVANKDKLIKIRKRLANISWFMKALNEYISRMANEEDDCKGTFWESRFKCTRLLDSSALMAAMAYVDLNPIRAGLALTPENSEYTSAKCRCDGRRARKILQQQTLLDQRQLAMVKSLARSDLWLTPVFRTDKTVPGEELVPATLDQYLDLLDWTGRQIREGKRGAIPSELKPIMLRLEIDMDNWIETVNGFGGRFCRMAGKVEMIRKAAVQAGRKFFKGLGAAKGAFIQAAPST